MDGVLTLNSHFHAQAWQRFAREQLALDLDGKDPRVHGGRNVEILTALTGSRPSETALRACEDQKERYYRDLAKGNLRPVPGVLDYLDRLDALAIPYALVTSADRKNMTFVLSELQLGGRFTRRVSAEDIAHGKPHPEPFLKAASYIGVPPNRCIVHEDAPSGVRAGAAAGCFVAALTTTVDAEICNKPVRLIAWMTLPVGWRRSTASQEVT